MDRFGDIVRIKLESRRVSIRSFAKSVGKSHQFVARVLASQRLPPLDDVEAWLKAAEIADPSDALVARLAAHLEHCPPYIISYVEAVERGCDIVHARRAAERTRSDLMD